MAPRSFWKGYLKLSLVTCPVTLTPGTTEGGKVRFHTLNRATGNRVESRYVDSVTGKPVREYDEVKGYALEEDKYVLLEDDEIEAVGLESTRTINIDTFIGQAAIGWIWYDKPHYLKPDDKFGAEAFAVIREAMRATETVGIARLVIYRRERAVLLQPRDNGIVLWTLRYGDEVRDADAYFKDIETEKPDTQLMTLVKKLISERTKEWTPEMVSDPVQENMLALIEQKKKGRKKAARAKPAETEEPLGGDNVVSIMDALKNSIAREKKKS
jgi:DNA end-binding protein Ku